MKKKSFRNQNQILIFTKLVRSILLFSSTITHNKTIDSTSQVCDLFLLTEHGIVLSQAEQLDVLDLNKI